MRTLPRATGVSRALRARSPKKPGRRRKSLEKVSKKSEKSGKGLETVFFQTFWELGPGGFFQTFLRFRARRARETPVARGRVRAKPLPAFLKKRSCPGIVSVATVSLLIRIIHLNHPAKHRHTHARTQVGRGIYLRAACLQNETAPEELLNRYEKRFEKREKGSEKRSKTRLKIF